MAKGRMTKARQRALDLDRRLAKNPKVKALMDYLVAGYERQQWETRLSLATEGQRQRAWALVAEGKLGREAILKEVGA